MDFAITLIHTMMRRQEVIQFPTGSVLMAKGRQMIDSYIWIGVWVVILIMLIISLMKIESRIADDRINKMFEYLKKRERENDDGKEIR